MQIPYRPLGLVVELVERMGLEVTYSYDDLVFISHNAFMLRFGEKGELVDLFFNKECSQNESEVIEEQIQTYGKEYGLSITRKGRYDLSSINQSLSIHFFENTALSTATH